MHRESEYGIASHAIYKDAKNNVEENKNLLWIKSLLPAMSKLEEDKDNVIQAKEIPDWIRDMAELQTGAQTDEFAQNMSADFFQRRLFVFTPKGDVVDLPIDSTPIDFAYAIHSDVGDHLASAKIGGKMVSLDKKLKNGDIVDVQTNKNAKPSAKWIDIAKTSMAKRHIKDALGKNPRMKINPRIK
jgi:GTP pyrophosphokinase